MEKSVVIHGTSLVPTLALAALFAGAILASSRSQADQTPGWTHVPAPLVTTMPVRTPTPANPAQAAPTQAPPAQAPPAAASPRPDEGIRVPR